MAYVPMCIVVH